MAVRWKRLRTGVAGLLFAVLAPVSSSQTFSLMHYGPAPEFSGIDAWLNSKPLRMADLRGKVVLIDFWTYSCINCLRTLPYLTSWYDKYKDDGLVVIGVHTPEFDFERQQDNVEAALKRFGIDYPVATDNNYVMWNAYQNRYWPAEYLIDRNGNIAVESFGEGHYAEMENTLRKALGINLADEAKDPDLSQIDSPEMYFGLSRVANYVGPEALHAGLGDYTGAKRLPLNRFSISGQWKVADESIEATGGKSTIRVHFRAAKVHLVAGAATAVKLQVTVDGVSQPDVTVEASQLYTLFTSKDADDHQLEVQITGPGLKAFTLTFG